MKRYHELFTQHIKENITVYLFISTLLVIGIIFGAMIVNAMNFMQKQELYFHLEQFFGQLNSEASPTNRDIVRKSFYFHVKFLGILFFLGLTIIGIPFIWLFIFLKGLVIGFTIGFIVNQLGIKGFFIALISIAPHNIVIIPIYIIAGSLAMLFSIALLQKLFSKRSANTIVRPFMQYVLVNLVLIVVSLSGALIEGYIAHEVVKLVVPSIL